MIYLNDALDIITICDILLAGFLSMKEGEFDMDVLIVISKGLSQKLLVNLHTEKLKKEVSDLVNDRKHTQAIVTALTKGRFEREVACEDLKDLRADLILSEYSASWDLKK